MRVLLGCVAICAGALVVFSYAGALHPAGDSFAVLRYLLLGGVLISATLLYRAPFARIAVVTCAALLLGRVWMAQAGPELDAPDVIVYQKNMLFHDYDEMGLARDIWESGARIVTLQEVSAAHYDFLEIMKDTHPHQLVCGGTVVGAIAVLSMDLIVSRTCSDPAGIAVVNVAVKDGAQVLRVASVHLHWPWPHRQMESLEQILPQFEALKSLEGLNPTHTIVAGDFNMVPWGHALRRVGQVFDVARIGHVERTFDVMGYPITIDHVMTSPNFGANIDVRPRLGSDHFGVVGRIVFNAPSTHHHGDRSSGFRTRLR